MSAPGAGIESRRQQVRRRIQQLNDTLCRDARQLQRVMAEMLRLQVEGDALNVVRRVVMQVFIDIVRRTPVDTGRARAAWQFSTGSPSGKIPPAGDYPQLHGRDITKSAVAAAVSGAIATIETAPETVWYIANNVEYIQALEAGWSNQAPAGMLGLALQELSTQLERRLREV